MKNLLISFLFITAGRMACGQIPSSGNVLWLRADIGVFNNNSGTQAILGDLVQVWQDQSGNGNHFSQDINGYRPQLVAIANTLCSQPLIQFDVSRRTYLGSPFKLSGPKTILIVFLQPDVVSNPETLISIKGAGNYYTEVLCSDHPAYRSLSYMSDLPGSVSGGTMLNSVGNNVSFSSGGNIFTMTYNGGAISSPASYSSNYNANPVAVVPSGLFGRLMNDTSTIGARAPEQNYCFLSGYIAEIIVYDRVLAAAEISQVQTYLLDKYGFSGSCSVLPVNNMSFTAQAKDNAVQLDWSINDETMIKEYRVEHSINDYRWDSLKAFPAIYKKYRFIHNDPSSGNNYYRLRINYKDGRIKYSDIKEIDFYRTEQHISPNPATDHFYIRTTKAGPVHLLILNDKGQLLKEMHTYSNARIDINRLPAGLYFISLNGNTRKLIKNQ